MRCLERKYIFLCLYYVRLHETCTRNNQSIHRQDRIRFDSSGSDWFILYLCSLKNILILTNLHKSVIISRSKIDGNIEDAIGLLGNPLSGNRLLGGDGVTDLSKDWNIYGEEWQVRDTGHKLFQKHRAPQYPNFLSLLHL